MLQTIAIVVSLAMSVVAISLTVIAVRRMLDVLRVGQPALRRTDNPGRRLGTMLKETVLHTRMLQWTWVGILHWFAFAAFIFLATAVGAAFFQLFAPTWTIPFFGNWFVYEWTAEALGVLGTVGIIPLFIYRLTHMPKDQGRKTRFFGSTMWQAFFVEAMVLLESSAILFIRGAEYNLGKALGGTEASHFGGFNFPVAQLFGHLYPTGAGSVDTLKNIIYVIATIKIVSAMIWLIVIATNLTMGVAWHRFTVWFNIFYKRESVGRDTDGQTLALGAMKPLTSAGKVITLDDIDDLDEDAKLGAGTIDDFSWKGILDFTTCTECGRCQSQCPAWNTEKPLSPKLLVMGLREHAYASAPYLEGSDERRELPLIGKTSADQSAGEGEEVLDWFYNPADGGFVIDEDVLWSCTSCGACVQQCPVDIEHVDHIMDMRRYQVLVESNFPSELNGLFKGLENKGNPWNMSPNARLDWAKDLPFEVKVVGGDGPDALESLESVDWLFWVGCAGAYEDRAKKTTRAVAELLDMAGISFGVLGNGETCTGDPARRAGNEFVFQGLAQQNVETFKEFKVKKAVTTCAHCFNTLKNEYKQFGIELEVVHHTQLLNRLVREGKLTPVADGAGAHKRSITYHDPCYIGRHNGVYTPPRELLQVLPGAEYVEMPRNSERSFCCGAGGARMWMEEKIGQRINRNRTDEAVATGADQIAVGCPFCRVMLSDGLTASQADGTARESVEVLDVAQMLLASVKGQQATKLLPGESTDVPSAPAAKKADVATKAEPSAGDVTITENTVTETADAGPAAKASGGSSLFDTPAQEEPKAAPASGGSLFDDSSSLFDTPAAAPEAKAAEAPAAEVEPVETPKSELGGGSLFDIPASETATTDKAAEAPAPVAATTEPAETAPAENAPRADLGAGGSLFDIPAQAPTASASPAATAAPEAEPASETTGAAESAPAEAAPQMDLGAGGSLFDIPAQAPTASASPAATAAPEAEPASEAPEAPVATPAEDEAAEVEPVESSAPASSGTASAPKTDVDFGSLGSLFDIEAPAGAVASAPAPAAAAPVEDTPAPSETPAPEAKVAETSAAKVEPVETPAAEAKPAETATPEVEPVATTSEAPVAAPASSGTASAPKTDVDFGSLASLFDIEAPAGAVSSAPAPAPAPAQPAVEPAPVEAEAPTADAPAEPEVAPEPMPEAQPAEAPAEEQAEEPQPTPVEEKPAAPAASSGATNTPRTDVDIHGAGSLFDL